MDDCFLGLLAPTISLSKDVLGLDVIASALILVGKERLLAGTQTGLLAEQHPGTQGEPGA